MPEKQQASVWRDLIEPGWREREAERVAKFLAAVPVRHPCRRIGCLAPDISCAAGEASHAECQHFAPTPIPPAEPMNHHTRKYLSYCCQACGEPVGWLGRGLEWLFGTMHKCWPPVRR